MGCKRVRKELGWAEVCKYIHAQRYLSYLNDQYAGGAI
jgi:hypothetical protein